MSRRRAGVLVCVAPLVIAAAATIGRLALLRNREPLPDSNRLVFHPTGRSVVPANLARRVQLLGQARAVQELVAEAHVCFADPNYEKKSPEWKYYYRAGKQPVEAARAFATSWLADVEKK